MAFFGKTPHTEMQRQVSAVWYALPERGQMDESIRQGIISTLGKAEKYNRRSLDAHEAGDYSTSHVHLYTAATAVQGAAKLVAKYSPGSFDGENLDPSEGLDGNPVGHPGDYARRIVSHYMSNPQKYN